MLLAQTKSAAQRAWRCGVGKGKKASEGNKNPKKTQEKLGKASCLATFRLAFEEESGHIRGFRREVVTFAGSRRRIKVKK